MKAIKVFLLSFMVAICFSCKELGRHRTILLVNEWSNKVIFFPENIKLISFVKDSIYTSDFPETEYKIISYVDSIGCMSCKLHLDRWRLLIAQLDSIKNTSILLFLHPKNKEEMAHVLQRDRFTHPVCIDEKDLFNKLNKFPSDMIFQTFLLDKSNKVIAIGNPIHNPKIKELYMKIVIGDTSSQKSEKNRTAVLCEKETVELGKFNWQQEQVVNFILNNTGQNPLVIIDVVTSCGCTTVEYPKEPVPSGGNIVLETRYKADHPEHFRKTIAVHCNVVASPINLKITGTAE